MQKLFLESAWDKTIAPADRVKITNHFHEHVPHLLEKIHFSFYKKAINHKNELLITVLIHNAQDIALNLQNVVITYKEENKQVATGIFIVPVKIEKYTSMPWTFIFSQTNETNLPAQHTISHTKTNEDVN